MKITLIGCGGWGERIAAALHACEVKRVACVDQREYRATACAARKLGWEWSRDLDAYLDRGGVEDGGVIVATPPSTHASIVEKVCATSKPVALRVEKPLADNAADGMRILGAARGANAALTTGFTLLHDALYEAAFDYLQACNASVTRVRSVRIGAGARHATTALWDLGAHGASIGAYLDANQTLLVCGYSTAAQIRRTTISSSAGVVTVDELSKRVSTPDGELSVAQWDALRADVFAWLDGEHRGREYITERAHRIISENERHKS